MPSEEIPSRIIDAATHFIEKMERWREMHRAALSAATDHTAYDRHRQALAFGALLSFKYPAVLLWICDPPDIRRPPLFEENRHLKDWEALLATFAPDYVKSEAILDIEDLARILCEVCDTVAAHKKGEPAPILERHLVYTK